MIHLKLIPGQGTIYQLFQSSTDSDPTFPRGIGSKFHLWLLPLLMESSVIPFGSFFWAPGLCSACGWDHWISKVECGPNTVCLRSMQKFFSLRHWQKSCKLSKGAVVDAGRAIWCPLLNNIEKHFWRKKVKQRVNVCIYHNNMGLRLLWVCAPDQNPGSAPGLVWTQHILGNVREWGAAFLNGFLRETDSPHVVVIQLVQ